MRSHTMSVILLADTTIIEFSWNAIVLIVLIDYIRHCEALRSPAVALV